MRMLFYRFLFFGVSLLCWTIVPAQPDTLWPTEPVPFDPAVRTGVLDNGLHYYIRRNDKPAHRAELRLAVRAGSLQEDEDQRGIAHFVEHMAFNGTRHFAKNDLIDYLESIGARFGADLNAYTSFGETVYLLQARTDSLFYLEQALLILQDWAGGLSFDTAEIDKERGVVVSEWRSRLNPDQRLQQQYFPLLYQGSRYAERLPIGDPALIDTAGYAAIRRFYTDWYRPDLMGIVAVGDFDVDWMEKELHRRFASLPAPNTPRQREIFRIPRIPGTRIARCADPEAPFTRIQVVYPHDGHPVETQADFRQELIHTLYNNMLNGRLFEVQQSNANPPFTFAYSGYGGDIGNRDVYLVSAFTAGGKALDGLRAVLLETQRARLHGFTASELERKKAELLRSSEQAALEQDKTGSDALAGRLLQHFLSQNPAPNAEQTLELIRRLLPTIQLNDIAPLADQWLRSDSRVVVVTGPGTENAPLPSESDILALLAEVDHAEPEPYVDRVPEGPLLAELPPFGSVRSQTHYPDIDVTELTLSNGVRVILKPTDFQNDQVLLTAFSPGGHSLYGDQDYQSASNAAALIGFSGVGPFSLPDLEKKLAGSQVTLSPYITELYEGFSGNCSPEDLETLLQLVYLYFTAPRCDSIALASFLTRQRSIVENMFINPYYYFAEVKNQIKYDNHPRRRMTTMADLDAISRERALEVFRDRFADASDFTFVVVGNFSLDTLQPWLCRYLGSLPATGRQENWRDIGAGLHSGRLDTVLVRGQAPKALVEITFHGSFTYASQERYDFYSMVDILRIKLRESMREEKGGVYGVRVNGTVFHYPTPSFRITLSFTTEPSDVQLLIQTALQEIERLKADGATEKDLEKVRETQRQERIKNLRENSFWLAQLAARYREDIALEGIQLPVYEQYLNRLSSPAIQQAAQRYLGFDNYLQLILMPEQKTEK